jgi:hypothetical protein
MSWSNPQVVGKVAGEEIVAELGDGLGHDVLVTVLLIQDYEPHHPPGYPFRIAHGVRLVPAGVVLELVKPEAAALVAAGAATYGGQPPQPTEPPANVTAPYCGGPSGGDTEPVGTTLSCTKGTWSNADDVQTAYQWERDEETIEGATGDEYTTGNDDEDCALRCWVRVKNAAGAARAVSNEVTIVAAALPEQHGAQKKGARKRPHRIIAGERPQ